MELKSAVGTLLVVVIDALLEHPLGVAPTGPRPEARTTSVRWNRLVQPGRSFGWNCVPDTLWPIAAGH